MNGSSSPCARPASMRSRSCRAVPAAAAGQLASPVDDRLPPSLRRLPARWRRDVLRQNDRARSACSPLDLAVERAQRYVFARGDPDVDGVRRPELPAYGGLARLTRRTRAEGDDAGPVEQLLDVAADRRWLDADAPTQRRPRPRTIPERRSGLSPRVPLRCVRGPRDAPALSGARPQRRPTHRGRISPTAGKQVGNGSGSPAGCKRSEQRLHLTRGERASCAPGRYRDVDRDDRGSRSAVTKDQRLPSTMLGIVDQRRKTSFGVGQ